MLPRRAFVEEHLDFFADDAPPRFAFAPASPDQQGAAGFAELASGSDAADEDSDTFRRPGMSSSSRDRRAYEDQSAGLQQRGRVMADAASDGDEEESAWNFRRGGFARRDPPSLSPTDVLTLQSEAESLHSLLDGALGADQEANREPRAEAKQRLAQIYAARATLGLQAMQRDAYEVLFEILCWVTSDPPGCDLYVARQLQAHAASGRSQEKSSSPFAPPPRSRWASSDAADEPRSALLSWLHAVSVDPARLDAMSSLRCLANRLRECFPLEHRERLLPQQSSGSARVATGALPGALDAQVPYFEFVREILVANGVHDGLFLRLIAPYSASDLDPQDLVVQEDLHDEEDDVEDHIARSFHPLRSRGSGGDFDDAVESLRRAAPRELLEPLRSPCDDDQRSERGPGDSRYEPAALASAGSAANRLISRLGVDDLEAGLSEIDAHGPPPPHGGLLIEPNRLREQQAMLHELEPLLPNASSSSAEAAAPYRHLVPAVPNAADMVLWPEATGRASSLSRDEFLSTSAPQAPAGAARGPAGVAAADDALLVETFGDAFEEACERERRELRMEEAWQAQTNILQALSGADAAAVDSLTYDDLVGGPEDDALEASDSESSEFGECPEAAAAREKPRAPETAAARASPQARRNIGGGGKRGPPAAAHKSDEDSDEVLFSRPLSGSYHAASRTRKLDASKRSAPPPAPASGAAPEADDDWEICDDDPYLGTVALASGSDAEVEALSDLEPSPDPVRLVAARAPQQPRRGGGSSGRSNGAAGRDDFEFVDLA